MKFFLNVIAAFIGVLAAAFFMFLLMFMIIGSLASSSEPTVERGSVLVLDLSGTLPETQPSDPFTELFERSSVTLTEAIAALERATHDDRIVGVWLNPSFVMASVPSMNRFREAMIDFRESGKPLIASSGTFGFLQSGYFLASAADSVFTPPEAMFLLNGFEIAGTFYRGTLDKLGIEPTIIRAGDYKGAGESFSEYQFSPENRQQYEELLFSIDDTFRSAVAESRSIPRERIDEIIASGGYIVAQDGLDAGFVDALRYEHEVEDFWLTYTDQEQGDELRTISLSDYRNISDSSVGMSAGNRNNRIAVIHATGSIMASRDEGGLMGGEILASDEFIETLREAVNDDRVKAIVIRIDSPGGSAAASDAMWAAIEEAKLSVPVVVSMSTVAASGGYYMAAPADVIIAEPGTITGSIGVITMTFNAQEFMNDRLGVTVDPIRTGPSAGLFGMYKPLSEEEYNLLQRFTDVTYETFLNRVAEGRGMDIEDVRALAGGRIYTGDRALELGLVDEIGGLQYAITRAAGLAELEEGDYRTLVLPQQRPLFERLAESMGSTSTQLSAWLFTRGLSPEEIEVRRHAEMLRGATNVHALPQMRMYDIPDLILR